MKRRLRSAAPSEASPLAKGLETPRKRRKISPPQELAEEAPPVTSPIAPKPKPKPKKMTMRMARFLAEVAAAKDALLAEMEVDTHVVELDDQEMMDVVSCCFLTLASRAFH